MEVVLIGAGYVGVATGVALAAHGHGVTLVDRDPRIVAEITEGRAPFYEPGLPAALREATTDRGLRATSDLAAAVRTSSVVLLCVGTPPDYDGSVDLRQVVEAASQVASLGGANGVRRMLVVKSTVVPGTTEHIVEPIFARSEANWSVAVNPEFLREGNALEDALHPDRIVIGATDLQSAAALDALYEGFEAPRVHVPPATAEMIKYASNALLATLISFSNEIANICEQLPGVSAADVFRTVHLDSRLSPSLRGERVTPGVLSYLLPGCGYGGSCLPKDVAALVRFAQGKGTEPALLDAVRRVNEARPGRLVDHAAQRLGGVDGRAVAVLGLTFKPDTDDMRGSPAIAIVEELLAGGAWVRAYDPAGYEQARARWGDRAGLTYTASVEEALRDADAALLVTAWREIAGVDPAAFGGLMRRPLVLDGRGMLHASADDRLEYWSVGDGPRG